MADSSAPSGAPHRPQTLQVFWNPESMKDVARKVYDQSLPKFELAFLTMWINSDRKNYELALKEIRELGLSQNYVTEKIKNTLLRNLLEEVTSMRPELGTPEQDATMFAEEFITTAFESICVTPEKQDTTSTPESKYQSKSVKNHPFYRSIKRLVSPRFKVEDTTPTKKKMPPTQPVLDTDIDQSPVMPPQMTTAFDHHLSQTSMHNKTYGDLSTVDAPQVHLTPPPNVNAQDDPRAESRHAIFGLLYDELNSEQVSAMPPFDLSRPPPATEDRPKSLMWPGKATSNGTGGDLAAVYEGIVVPTLDGANLWPVSRGPFWDDLE